MSVLVDTNAWIPFFQGDPQTPRRIRRILDAQPAACWISMASVWEASIKVGLGKLNLPYSIADDFPRMLEECGFRLLPLEFEDVTAVEALPQIHRDPFDRVQAAQCVRRHWTLLSRDPVFDRYGISRVWS